MNNMNQIAITGPNITILAEKYINYLLATNRAEACALITQAALAGVSIKDIYLKVLSPAQYKIGTMWQENLISVAVEHFCTAVTQLAMSQLFPLIVTTKKNGFSMVGCCVGRELHEIGMRMVSDFFEMDGFTTYYLGANCPIKSVAEAVSDRNANLLCLSVTMYQNLTQTQEIIELVKHEFPDIKIMLGGYPFSNSPDLAKRMGADGYATDAQTAIILGRKLCSTNKV